MRLFVMRHGSTAGNAERRYVGRRTDEPLSAEGLRQCGRAGSLPDVDVVYVSSLQRALETARRCFPAAELRPAEGLEEYDFGVFEGLTAQEMENDPAYRNWVEGGCVGACPGGESRAQFVERTCATFERIVHEAARRGEERVVIVAHGGTIMAVFSSFAQQDGQQRDYFSWHVDTCEGYRAELDVDEEPLCLRECRHVGSLADLS